MPLDQIAAPLARALMLSILDTLATETKQTHVDASLLSRALITCQAALIEADPQVKTQPHMRLAAEHVADQVLAAVKDQRRSFKNSGRRVFFPIDSNIFS